MASSLTDLRLILDGGMGTTLIEEYPQVPDILKLWSTAFLVHQPSYVLDLHKRFILAGSDVIITSNYSTAPRYLNNMGMIDRLEELVETAGKLAREAADSARGMGIERPILVAGCIPPLNYSYLGEKIEKMEDASLLYEKIAKQLDPYTHFYICETMSSLDEAIASLTGVMKVAEKPVWISFNLQDNELCRLHSHEPLQEVLPVILDKFPSIKGVTLNCCNHDTISRGLDVVMESVKGRKNIKYIGAYANNSKPKPDKETVEKEWEDFDAQKPYGEWHSRPLVAKDYAEIVKSWVEKGCNVVGGCCGMGPEFTAEISKQWFPKRELQLTKPNEIKKKLVM